jgi:hypothetical protein
LLERLRAILIDVVSGGCVAGAGAVAGVVAAVVKAAVIVAPAAAAAIPWEPQRHF